MKYDNNVNNIIFVPIYSKLLSDK